MKKIVTIGGGTGSFTLLSGLKKYPVKLTAIVSMADDGGSTGRLRDELGVLPPGDIRQCLVALSEESKIVRDLMKYRFTDGELKGHNFGNLFLSALEKIRKDFATGVKDASRILNIKGEVVPVVNKKVKMHIRLKNNEIMIGENKLDSSQKIRKIGVREIFLRPRVSANPEALKKIKEAEMIIIGPGDYFGSLIPNFLVQGISEAIQKTKAKVVYICNLTNKKGQTEKFTLKKYITELNKFIGQERIEIAIFNKKRIASKLIKKYEKKEGKNSVVKLGSLKKKQYKIIQANLLEKNKLETKDSVFIRHNSDKLAQVIMKILDVKK